MGQRVTSVGELNRKGRRRETESEEGVGYLRCTLKSTLVDPKPGDLSMTRVKGR